MKVALILNLQQPPSQFTRAGIKYTATPSPQQVQAYTTHSGGESIIGVALLDDF